MADQCPCCRSANLAQAERQTLAYYAPFVDSQGQSHRHDANRQETEFTCIACGTRWTVMNVAAKCWCGWPDKTQETKMAGKFDYVRYDADAQEMQRAFKDEVEKLDKMIGELPKGRYQSLAVTDLEKVYMWIGKAIRDHQIERNGSAPLQEERGHE